MVLFRVLGPFEVLGDDGRVLDLGRPKERALLAVLTLEVGQVVSADALAAQLWPDAQPAGATSSLQSYVSNLRRVLAPADGTGAEVSVLRTQRPGWVLDVDPGLVDAVLFDAAAEEGRAALAAGRFEEAQDLLVDAEGLWRGEPLADMSHVPAAVAFAGLMAERRLAVTEDRVDARLALGRHADAVAELEGLVIRHPMRERLTGQLVLSLYRTGRQAEALRACARLRTTLRDELGLDPAPSLRDLEARVLRQDPSLDTPSLLGRDEQVRPPAVTMTGLPPALRPARPVSLCGRRDELARIIELWTKASAGTRSCVAINGEAGIGKTRLASEVAARAISDGAFVLAGRCYEENLVAYQPMVEALRALQADLGLDAIVSHAGPHASDLAPLLPALGRDESSETSPSSPGTTDGESERYLLFESVHSFLASLAASGPAVLVLDDMQWVDGSTVLLLRHLLRHPEPVSLLVVLTHRPLEDAPESALSDLLAELRRDGLAERVDLVGLEEHDVAALIRAHAGEDLPEGFASSVHSETEGNPFFVEEVLLHLLDQDRRQVPGDPDDGAAAVARLGIPDGVNDLIGRRLRRLPDGVQHSLEAASVLGREFGADLVTAVTGQTFDELVEHLDAARRARLITDGSTPGSCTFAHPLVREALYGALTGLRRASLHRRVADAMAVGRRDVDIDALAHHAFEGLGAGGAELAVTACRAAAQANLGAVAFEESVVQIDHALIAAEASGSSPGERAELLLIAADAIVRTGDLTSARLRVHQASGLARRAQRPDLLATGALLFAGVATADRSDPEVMAMLDEALSVLPDGPSGLRAAVTARLAMEECFADHRRSDQLSATAVAMARAAGEQATLATVLGSRHWVLGDPAAVPEQLAIAEEIIAIGQTLGDDETEFSGRHYRMLDLLTLGRIDEAGEEVPKLTALAERMRQPRHLWQVSVYGPMLALLRGHLDDAEGLATVAFDLGQVGQATNALVAYGASLFALRFEQGRLIELDSAVRDFVDQYPGLVAWRCALAWLCCEAGDLDEARSHIAAIVEGGLERLPRDTTWLVAMTFLSFACAVTGEAEAAGELRRLLQPGAGMLVVVAAGFACVGPVDLPLALLADLDGDRAQAEVHFSAAAELSRAVDAPSWAARVDAAWASSLRRHGDGSQLSRAVALASAAAAEMDRLGVGGLTRLAAATAATTESEVTG